MKKVEPINVEVDMVPLIDIISLLLMFLLVVGGAVNGERSIEMRLPRADQALSENLVVTEGRVVVQMVEKGGKYFAVVNNKYYELIVGGGQKSLIDYLEEQVSWWTAKGICKKDSNGTVGLPVKLRIPEIAPMHEVEKVVMTLTRAGLVNIQYAAQRN